MLINYAGLFFLHKMVEAGVLVVGIELRLQNTKKCSLGREQSHYNCWEDNYYTQVHLGAGSMDTRVYEKENLGSKRGSLR